MVCYLTTVRFVLATWQPFFIREAELAPCPKREKRVTLLS
jgi:hypothetical protein